MNIKLSVILGLISAFCLPLQAAYTVYARNRAGFDPAAAAYPKLTITFDDIAAGTNIGGTKHYGVTFAQNLAPLIVVRGADTYTPAGFAATPHPETNRLIPTSGENVLSPGGAVLGPGNNPAVEDDDITMSFNPPVRVLGFDHLSQSADGGGYTYITVYGLGGAVIYTGYLPISYLGGGGAPAGNDFWGIISDQDICRAVIEEGDGNATYPDCNIGIDSVIIQNRLPSPDVVGDCAINQLDLKVLAAEWLATDAAGLLTADFNLDGVVDMEDFAILSAHWLKTVCQ